ncbi:MAG TPA: hypothetical protein VGN01_04240 [Acidobacteriaceae bacterium]|jgi:hypothetical protein
MRVLVLCLIASLAFQAAAQINKTAPKPSATGRPASAPKPAAATTPAHFSAAGLNNEDDLVRIYSGDFPSIHLDRASMEFMLIISSYMEDFARDCKQFLPPNKVEIMTQVCEGSNTYTYSPDGQHDIYGNRIDTTPSCYPHTVGTGLYADPQLYAAVQDVSAKAQLKMIGGMLGVTKGKDGGTVPNLLSMPAQLTDQLVAVGTEMETVIHTNTCGSPGLKNFQSNLIRFANAEAPIKYAGAVVSAPIAVLPGVRDADFTRLLDDLVSENARGWMMNRYQPGSISDPIVSHDPSGSPLRIMARYSFSGAQGRQQGRVTLSFKDGVPECLYFSDSPDSCRVPSTRIISAYQKNAYAKYTAAEVRQSPFADGCNAFMKTPKTSKFAPSDPEGYCQCLSDGYQKVMTPAEEASYGKNFEEKFWRGIAQPTSNDDPAWPRLHPVAVSCMQ